MSNLEEQATLYRSPNGYWFVTKPNGERWIIKRIKVQTGKDYYVIESLHIGGSRFSDIRSSLGKALETILEVE